MRAEDYGTRIFGIAMADGFRAVNEVESKSLAVSEDSATVGGKNVVRSVNSVTADALGNVALAAVANSGSFSDLTNKPESYVIETYRNGDSWYRKWSDGWIEQGGFHPGTGQWTNYHAGETLTFVTPFTQVNNAVYFSLTDGGDICNPYDVTKTGCSLWLGDRWERATLTDQYFWYACGY